MVTNRNVPKEASYRKQLSSKQEVFVRRYIESWNASEAARVAGYSRPHNVSGAKVLGSPAIQALIQRQLEEVGLTPDFVKFQLSMISRASIADFLSIDDQSGKAKFDIARAARLGSLRFARRITIRNGEITSIEMIDVVRALDILARLLGLYGDETKPSQPTSVDRDFWEGGPLRLGNATLQTGKSE
jgi:hypothetical protein